MKNATQRASRVALSSSNNGIAGNPKNCILSEARRSAQASPPNLITVFKERCQAQALMVAEGMLELQDAVDSLQKIAIEQGPVQYHGQDCIQEIMSDAFKRGGRP
jgi:hypothetical protein